MNRTIKITVVVLALVFLMETGSGWTEELELTPITDDEINFVALEILRNAFDKPDYNSKVGDKLKDYYLVPLYDGNNFIVRYWIIGYKGEGQIKNLEELIDSLWYPYNLWEQEEGIYDQIRENVYRFHDEIITYEEFVETENSLREELWSTFDKMKIYASTNYSDDYLHASIGPYYEIPPVEACANNGLPGFIIKYWEGYFHIKQKYQTDDIEFIKFVYDSEVSVNLMFKVNDSYVYTTASGEFDEISKPTEIKEQEQFEGFDLYHPPPNATFIKDFESGERKWEDLGLKFYIEGLEKHGMVKENKTHWLIGHINL